MQKIGFCERYRLTTAVLNKTKELTRRLEKALERAVTEYEKKWGKSFSIVSQYYDKGFDKIGICTPNEPIYLSTRYKLGEVVAVAQSYEDIYIDITDDWEWFKKVEDAHGGKDYCLLAGTDNKMFVKPSLMPHQIKITGVRIERLQDISDEDCLKEGIYRWKNMEDCPKSLSENQRNSFGYYGVWDAFSTPREAFAALINRPGVGRKGLWEYRNELEKENKELKERM